MFHLPDRLDRDYHQVIAAAMVATGCNDPPAVAGAAAAGAPLAADVAVQFSKAADAANRAVMADTDEASIAAAEEAQTNEGGRAEVEAFQPILAGWPIRMNTVSSKNSSGGSASIRPLDSRFSLAVENTNLKAQRLSFGPARKQPTRSGSSESVARCAMGEAWRVKALVATAVGGGP